MTEEPSQILPFLYLGSAVDARNERRLPTLGISRILNVSDSARFPDDASFVLRHIPVSDFGDTNLAPIFAASNTFISAAKLDDAPVLVHCRHGQNRSPTVVVAYLMEREGMSLKEAYQRVSTVRPRIAIHEAYFEQLQQMEFARSGTNTLSQDDIGPSVQELIRRLRAEADTKE